MYGRVFKRAIDLLLVAVIAPAAGPVSVLAALAVVVTSGRPALFRQSRIGWHGAPFVVLKLRTMTTSDGGPQFTIGATPRVTPAGRLLRRWKIDELPQLWNVVRGEMSIVGPRPEVPDWVAKFPEEFEVALTTPPGLTDLASVAYFDEASILAAAADPESQYANVVLPEKLAMNKVYASNRSLVLDLRIIGLTVLGFIRPEKAARRARRLAERLS